MNAQKIAIQGLRGSFHHEAANYFFGHHISLLECKTFQEVVKSVTEGTVNRGIMAIENSIAGCIIQNYMLLRANNVEVTGEVGIRVKLNLMGLTNASVKNLEEVYSHQMALRQCGNFFDDYPDIKVIETFDTAGSAKMVKNKNSLKIGAVAGRLAAQVYDLKIITAGIEDHSLNYTRFLILKKTGDGFIENPNKVSVYFRAKHDSGSLARILTIISGLGINLGKLQSHPVPSKNSLYGFFATLEIDETAQLEDLEKLMKRMTIQFEILGAYMKGETHG